MPGIWRCGGESFETTLVGLSARLEANPGNNLEESFPTSAAVSVSGEDLAVEIYAFKPGKADAYRSTQGIIFTINGQTHGALSKAFFGRKRVKMGRLRDSLLVVVVLAVVSGLARRSLHEQPRPAEQW